MGTEQDAAKLAAGQAAVRTYLRDGMTVGLGSGSTSAWFVRSLGEAVAGGLRIVGVPTSAETRDLAAELGIPLAELDDVEALDITIDGADEIDPAGAMIKGGGARLLWERIVASASRRVVAIVDPSKLVDALGAFPLPIEIVPFGRRSTRRALAELLADAGYGEPRLELRGGDATPMITDGGHLILDAHLGRIADPATLATRLKLVPGVVETGLFVDVADEIVIGHADGTAEIRPART